MKLRALPFLLAFFLGLQQNLHAQILSDYKETPKSQEDSEFLDGYIGIGGAFIDQISSGEQGTRENVRIEFARLRKWISFDARVGFGKGYTDFGGLFRLYKHWTFNDSNSTGFSLGAGVGGMYSQGIAPDPGDNRLAFIDVIAAPFVRYIWDWGMGMGASVDLEYQLVPFTDYTNASSSDNISNNSNLRSRVMLGFTLLFEIDD